MKFFLSSMVLSQPVVVFLFANVGHAPSGTWILLEYRLSRAPGFRPMT